MYNLVVSWISFIWSQNLLWEMKNLLPVSYKWKREGKYYKVEEHIQLTRRGRRYSWDIPPDEKGQNAKDQDGFGLQSWRKEILMDKPPNVTDFNIGWINLKYMGGKSYRWDSYRAPSLGEFVNREV